MQILIVSNHSIEKMGSVISALKSMGHEVDLLDRIPIEDRDISLAQYFDEVLMTQGVIIANNHGDFDQSVFQKNEAAYSGGFYQTQHLIRIQLKASRIRDGPNNAPRPCRGTLMTDVNLIEGIEHMRELDPSRSENYYLG
jgi:hypothetical protein